MLTSVVTDERFERTEQVSHPAKRLHGIRDRTEALLRTEAAFIPNASFVGCDGQTDEEMLECAAKCDRSESATWCPRDLPAHLARLCEAELLTAENERNLFRAMNYLKYRVNVLRSRLDPDASDRELVERAEEYLRAAHRIRDHIVRANMRLVLSIVKKFVTPQYSFDELLSDGIETLIYVVDKFDFGRGFRFSTYAYRSIARCAYRQIVTRQKDVDRLEGAAEEIAVAHSEYCDRQLVNETSWDKLSGTLDGMLSRLDRRERYIVRRRYAIGTSGRAETFQSMANKLGVSKERVRQLEKRAVDKLRTMAGEMGTADLFEIWGASYSATAQE